MHGSTPGLAGPELEGDATLLPEAFEVNADIVQKAADAARAALERVARRTKTPISGPLRSAMSVTREREESEPDRPAR
ncbi:MAG: hypothetical protein R3B09_22145 [Nannocystaceae bacterium]